MKFLITVLVFFISLTMHAQLTPQQALEQMARGINLGNTLEPPQEGDWAPSAKEYFFDDYKTAGFTTVRIPVRWYTHTAEEVPYAVAESWMNRVEQVVDWALERGFIVIVNAHHSEPIKLDYEGEKARWDSIWSQVSIRFKDKSERLFFELMNEPKGWTQANVNEYNQRVLGIVRKTNPTRIVVLAGKEWSSAEELITPNLVMPDDDYLFGTFHMYNPWGFAGQGIGTWGTSSDKNAIKASFDKIQNWSILKGIPVLIGEFGATHEVDVTKAESDLNSRYRWYACYVENCLRTKTAFTVWDDSGWFEVYLRDERKWNEMKDILIHYSTQSPTDFTAEIMEDSTVRLEWKNQALDYDSITVQRRRDNDTYKSVGKVVKGVVQYVDSTLSIGYGYHYRLITHQSEMAPSFSYPQYVLTKPRVRSTFNTEPFSLPGVVEAEEFDEGVDGLTYHDTDVGNQGGVFRMDMDVDIQERTEGGYHVAWIDSSEWMEYTINVVKATTFNVYAHVASEEPGGSFSILFEKGSTRTFNIPSTGSWQETTELKTTVRLPAGKQIMRIAILKGPFNLDKLVFEDPNALSIVSSGIESMTIYPNPTKGTFIINSPNFIYDKIEVVDLNGKTVYMGDVDAGSITSTTHKVRLNPGVFFLKLYNGDKRISKKLIISK